MVHCWRGWCSRTLVLAAVVLGDVACQGAIPPVAHQGIPLACVQNAPAETLSGFGRCVLEAYRPCQIVQDGLHPNMIAVTFDPTGHLASEARTNFQPQAWQYAYDAAGRLTAIEEAGATVQFAYDGLGNVSQRTDAMTTTTYQYDPAGRLVEVDVANYQPRSTQYRYDDTGRLAEADQTGFEPSATMFTYDAHGQLTQTDRAGFQPNTTMYAYDADARVTEVDRTNFQPSTERFTYDASGRLAHVSVTGSAATETDFVYECASP
jgi:YD repeat-containing protein